MYERGFASPPAADSGGYVTLSLVRRARQDARSVREDVLSGATHLADTERTRRYPVEPTPPITEAAAASEHSARIDWRLVAIFYAVCFTLVSLVTLGLYFAGATLGTTGAQLTFQLTIAFLYMPAPLISALITERIGRRRPLIRTTFTGFGRKLPRLLVTYVALSAAVYLAYLLFAFLLGNVVHVPGVGDLVTSQTGLTSNVTTMFSEIAQGHGIEPPSAAELNMPPLGLLYVIALVGGLVAGVTINGLFAYRRGVRVARLPDGRAAAVGRHARQPADRRAVGVVPRADHPAGLQLRTLPLLGHPDDGRAVHALLVPAVEGAPVHRLATHPRHAARRLQRLRRVLPHAACRAKPTRLAAGRAWWARRHWRS